MTYFCTVDAVRAALDEHPDYTGHDSVIASAIEQASALIRTYTRREWDLQQYTDFADTSDIDVAIQRGKGVYIVSLREKPVSVEPSKYPKLRYSPSGKWDDVADLDNSLFHVDPRKNQIIMYPAAMTYRPRSLRIVYWAGYPTMDVAMPTATNADPNCLAVPDNIRMACLAQAVFIVKRTLNDVTGTTRKDSQERLSSYGLNNTSGLVRDALALLRTEVRLFMGS